MTAMMVGSEPTSDVEDFSVGESRKMVMKINKTKKKSGGFQAMGLSNETYNAIMKKGYTKPTPIQRKVRLLSHNLSFKAIPVILSGRDVVAMARTGSGKTGAFLIPMLEKLQFHSSIGPRALIMSPTRELAIQTLKFVEELGMYRNLTAACILGGDRMEDQFYAMHKSPDIIIATPGRLLHVIMEMNLTLKTIEYVVFDEGDRLFELGFQEQLAETLLRLPSSRQTLVFSATLPSSLLEFTKARLMNPILMRLDSDCKLSELLKLVYITCLDQDKPAALLHILKHVIPADQQAVIFFATKHHVEFINMILQESSLSSCVIHSGLDVKARSDNVKAFRDHRIRFMLVTDLAARGIDIPLLDNVINYHFPAQAKLFVHRVGRVARAGRSGTAYSLVDSSENGYLFDLQLFLDKDLQMAPKFTMTNRPSPDVLQSLNNVIGRFPRALLTTESGIVNNIIDSQSHISSLVTVCERGFSKYASTRPKASSESIRRAKQCREQFSSMCIHPVFLTDNHSSLSIEDDSVFSVLRSRRVPTIFEALGKQTNSPAYQTMVQRRKTLDKFIDKKRKESSNAKNPILRTVDPVSFIEKAKTATIDNCEDFFIPYQRRVEQIRDSALSINQASDSVNGATLDLNDDDIGLSLTKPKGHKQTLVWDRRKKRYTGSDAMEGKANTKKVKTESGIYIPSTYKTDKYKEWVKKAHVENVVLDDIGPKGNNSKTADHTRSCKETPISAPYKTSHTTKYGSVVEFFDVPDSAKKSETTKNTHQSERKFNKKSSQPSSSAQGVRVLGTVNWKTRCKRNQDERRDKKEAMNIRGPNAKRSHGQVKRPEQVLRARRQKQHNIDKAKRLRDKKKARKRGRK